MVDRLVALQDIQHAVGVIEKGQEFGVNDPDLAESYLRRGEARRGFTEVVNSRKWGGLLWDGATVVCMASGPTLSAQDCETVRVWLGGASPPAGGLPNGPILDRRRYAVVVNTSFRRAPWSDVVYGGDDRWWRFHWDEVSRASARAEFFALDRTLYNVGAGRIRLLKHEALPGLGSKPGVIRQGGNSGYQAVCLAYWAGATKIVLLGYDCHNRGGAHWHGEHPPEMRVRNQYKFWIQQFNTLAPDLAAAGVPVLNCSPDSDIKCFPTATLADALGITVPAETAKTLDEAEEK